MKPLVALVALALGAGAVATTITIQKNPFAFTSMGRSQSVQMLEHGVPTRAVELPTSIDLSFAGTTDEVRIDEVRIEGRLRPIARPKPAVAVASGEDEVEITVIPAPCNDGEYRLLEEQRGVRLMCPGGSL